MTAVPQPPPDLDHLVLATPDLEAAVADVAERCGVTPVRGGSHVDRGTANHLLGLSPTAYLEIVGPDPAQPEPAQRRPFGIDDLDRTRLVTWAVHPPDPDAVVAAARAAGAHPGDLAPMSRRTPGGDLLRWRLTPDRGIVPFVIAWGDTPHPARDLPAVRLRSLVLRHPDPARIRERLDALGVTATVEPGPSAAVEVVLDTPRGDVALG